MRLLIAVFILILNLQSWTKADDIRDFQLEGMSIGDSLLDFFGKSQINNFRNYDNLPSDMRFRIVEFGETSDFKIKNYDVMQVYYKPNDKKFIIFGVRAALYCDDNNKCKNQQNKIINDLKQNFNYSFTKEKFKHPDDKSGKSLVWNTTFKLKDGGNTTIDCMDWSKKIEKNIGDKLMVGLESNEFRKFVDNEAYR